MALHTLSICAGFGGIDLGLRLACPEARTVCFVEREAFPASVLAAQMEAGRLDPAPIWSDLVTFDGAAWRGCVDLVTAGFPCQPWSAAGKRKGEEDDRWIWPDIARIIADCQPSLVFLENVSLDAFRRPRADLEDLGFRVPPAIRVSASDVGAPHRRDRWWVLAAHPDRDYLRQEQGRGEPGRTGEVEPGEHGAEEPMADSNRRVLQGEREPGLLDGQRQAQREDADGCGGQVPDSKCFGCDGQQNSTERDISDRYRPGWEEAASRTKQRSWWQPEPRLGRVAHGTPDRVDRLRAIGNGVVPLAAAHAFRALMEKLT